EKPRKLPWEQLREWWPGRVIEASRRSVQIGYGVKQAGELHSLVTEISPSEWRSIGFGDAHDASGYVELGSYSDGSRKIVPVDYDSVELPDDEGRAALSDAPFAYLDRWLSPTFPS